MVLCRWPYLNYSGLFLHVASRCRRTDDVFLCSYGIAQPVITLETLGTGRHDGREKPIHSLSRVGV